MLSREVAKSRVNLPVVKRLTQALGFVDDDIKEAAVGTIALSNLEMLAPAMPVVLRVLDNLASELPPDAARAVMSELRRRILDESYYMTLPMNLLRTPSGCCATKTATRIAFSQTASYDDLATPPFLKRDLVLHMHNWGSSAFVSTQRQRYNDHHPWVQRAVLVASFLLEDEGSHWRRRLSLSEFDRIALEWRQEKFDEGRMEIPV